MRTALAHPNELFICPRCEQPGKKHRAYAMCIDCQKAYAKKINREWQERNPNYRRPRRPARTRIGTKCGARKIIDPELVALARMLMGIGKSQAQTAALMGITRSVLRSRLKAMGLITPKVRKPKYSNTVIPYEFFKAQQQAQA